MDPQRLERGSCRATMILRKFTVEKKRGKLGKKVKEKNKLFQQVSSGSLKK